MTVGLIAFDLQDGNYFTTTTAISAAIVPGLVTAVSGVAYKVENCGTSGIPIGYVKQNYASGATNVVVWTKPTVARMYFDAAAAVGDLVIPGAAGALRGVGLAEAIASGTRTYGTVISAATSGGYGEVILTKFS